MWWLAHLTGAPRFMEGTAALTRVYFLVALGKLLDATRHHRRVPTMIEERE